MLSLRNLALGEVDDYLESQSPHYGIVEAVMLHHAWRPNQTTHPYHGESTMLGIQNSHIHSRGWRDIGANLYITPTGTIWTARPLSWNNWAHAYVNQGETAAMRSGRIPYSWDQIEPEAKEIAYPNRQFFNSYALGIEMIANFDDEEVNPVPTVLATTLDVIAIICARWELGPERIFFHRDVSAKSCPGKQLRRTWVREQVAERLGNSLQQVKVILRPGQLVGILSIPRGGKLVVPDGWDHREDLGKLFIDRNEEGG